MAQCLEYSALLTYSSMASTIHQHLDTKQSKIEASCEKKAMF
jgi:hypothetical protein